MGNPSSLHVPRLSSMRMSLKASIGLNDAEMAKIDGKLQGRSIPKWRASDTCDGLKHRLGLSKAELKTIVLGVPKVLGCSYDANIDPSLAALQRRLDLREIGIAHI